MCNQCLSNRLSHFNVHWPQHLLIAFNERGIDIQFSQILDHLQADESTAEYDCTLYLGVNRDLI